MKIDLQTKFRRRLERIVIKMASLGDALLYILSATLVLGGLERRASRRFPLKKTDGQQTTEH